MDRSSSERAKEIAKRVQARTQEILESIEKEEADDNRDQLILSATALKDAGLEDGVVIQMLQKWWDLRLSEAEEILNDAKDNLSGKSFEL